MICQINITSNKDFITDLGLQKSSAWIIPTHSLIYSNGATIGAVSINTYEVCTKQGILGIVPKTSLSVEYLYCLMSSNYFSKQVHRIITHGTMATVYLKDINKIKFLPVEYTKSPRNTMVLQGDFDLSIRTDILILLYSSRR